MDFKKDVNKLNELYLELKAEDIALDKHILPTLDFAKSRQNLMLQEFRNLVKDIKKEVNLLEAGPEHQEGLSKLRNIASKLDTSNPEEFESRLQLLADITSQVTLLKEEKTIQIPSTIPSEIYPELEADVNEMGKCFNTGCYRSVVVLCGRVLEVLLHRKYFEVTGNDLLEKNPGIGLGNLIAKMKEREVNFDPALTQQIHLINQVRIFSVHKKQEVFYPSRGQAQAVILYTMDVMEKLFKKE